MLALPSPIGTASGLVCIVVLPASASCEYAPAVDNEVLAAGAVDRHFLAMDDLAKRQEEIALAEEAADDSFGFQSVSGIDLQALAIDGGAAAAS